MLARHALGEYLRECGYRVLEAASSAEARLLVSERTAQIDIVLARADAEDGGGFALAAWIRQSHAGIEVILAGGVAAETGKAADLCEDGPAGQLPYDHQALLDQIRRLRAARDRAD